MPTYTTSRTNGDVLLSGSMPQVEYMYGCVPTAVAMLLGYYDYNGYQKKDLSKIVEGNISLKSRGTDGNAYDMDAFDTVLGNLAASREYVYRFYERDGKETTPEQELAYTFQSDNKTLKTDEWNCLADYLGTGQYWRGADNLVTLVSFCTLADLYNNNYSDVMMRDGDTVRMVRYNDTTMLPGLDLYVQSRGYLLDYEITGTYQVDVAGGSFTFNDYMKEIDSGRVVLISIEGHVMVGYGYNQKTQEIIFDDCYNADQRMQWGGTYHYADADRTLESITVIGFNLNGDVDLALVKTKSSQEKLVLNATADGTGSTDYCVAGNGNTVYLTYSVSNLGRIKSGKFQASVYLDGNLFSSGRLDSLSANETREISVALGKVSVGFHNVRVVLDESNAIQEVNGANNKEERSFLILKAGTEVLTGNRQVRQDETVSDIYVHGGTLTLNGGQAFGVVLRGTSGGNTFWGGRSQQGRANVSRGSYLSGAMVYERGEVNIFDGGFVADVHMMASGKLTVSGGGTAWGVNVESGGVATVKSGGTLTERILLSSGASASVESGGIVNFNLAALTPGSAARVNVLSRISGAPVYTLTVSGTQALGTYTLAGGASKFNQTISVHDTEGTVLGELKVKTTLALSHAAYKLKLSGEKLTLTVAKNDPPKVSKIKANITAPTTRDVTITASFSDDVALAASLYRIGEDGEWTAYGKKGVTVSENVTVYFKAVDTGGNESEIGICEVKNIDKSVLDNGDNNWLYSKRISPVPNSDEKLVINPLYDGVPEILLDRKDTVTRDGKQNFVGYGDPADYAKIEMANPSKLSFTVTASDKVKFVVYKLVESKDRKGNPVYKLKALQTTTAKWDRKTKEYVLTTKSLLLGLADENTSYYISVQSTNAKKNGFALYNVSLNPNSAKTNFYIDADNNDNNWLYKKKLKSQGEKALNSIVTNLDPVKISSAGTEIRFDADPVCEEAREAGWNNFVGFGDDTDYVKINLEATADLSFLIESTDKAKIFVYKINLKTDKKEKVTYSLKSLTSKTLKKARGATVYAAETKTIRLEAGVDYYIGVQSTNASKGGNAYYTVTVRTWTEVMPAASALSMPEDDWSVPGGPDLQDGLPDSLETVTAEAVPGASVPADILQDDGLSRLDSGLLA
jgi:hypothetical protein